jgi:agmatinase
MSDPTQGDDHTPDRAFTADSLYGIGGEATYAGARSFMRRRYSRDLAGVDVAVSGVPLDLATTNRPGARFGPAGIRAASANLSWPGGNWPFGFDPFETLAVIDYGDCAFDHGLPETITDSIEAHARTLLDGGVSMLTLGGDHYIAYPILKAHHAVHGPLSLIHFDAHCDTATEDEKRVDHGSMFYHAAKEGLVDPARSVQVGIRTYYPETHGFNILDANWVHENGVAATVAEILRVVGDRKAYITFDIDCLDPSFAPGTGTPVCGGLSSAQALAILRGLQPANLVGMDVVEVAPVYDHSEITSLAAATLALQYLSILAAQRR